MKSADEPGKRAEGAPAISSRRSPRLRQRVAWMYYVEEMTQSEIADALGIGRITVVRLLSESRAMGEVRITLSREVAALSRLEIEMQKAFDLPEVVVAPLSSIGADPRPALAAAAGEFVSDMLRPDMKVGLGWGRTLSKSLGYIAERQVPGLSVVSLLGGIMRARAANPSEFAWQFSRIFMAECYLLAAPAIVDSPQTKQALIERCGLREVFEFARSLDAIVVSMGSLALDTKTDFHGIVTPTDLVELREAGAVGDILYNFYDIEGRLVDHPLNSRSMSVPIETLRTAKARILVCGGLDKLDAMVGAFQWLRPTVVITDEISAEALLKRGGASKDKRPSN